jgi:hypothetical protein
MRIILAFIAGCMLTCAAAQGEEQGQGGSVHVFRNGNSVAVIRQSGRAGEVEILRRPGGVSIVERNGTNRVVITQGAASPGHR